ncbi:MAG: hypothetical protein R3C05_25185 [Pirellulaceae bacterium]
MKHATNLTVIGLLLLTCIGCGGDSQPQSSEPTTDTPPPAITAPPGDSAPAADGDATVPPPVSDGPGSGSGFDVPPNLGEAPTESASSPEDAEPEFKLPPAEGN